MNNIITEQNRTIQHLTRALELYTRNYNIWQITLLLYTKRHYNCRRTHHVYIQILHNTFNAVKCSAVEHCV